MAFISDEQYKLVTDSVPMVCVDVIPVRQRPHGWQIGIITRATGAEVGKYALLGGRVYHNELLDDAIARHIKTGWNLSSYSLWPGNSIEHPFYIQQYLHDSAARLPLGFDPSKHSVAMTYLIELTGEPQPSNEARAFHWITLAEIPLHAGYNQQVLMTAAFAVLTKA